MKGPLMERPFFARCATACHTLTTAPQQRKEQQPHQRKREQSQRRPDDWGAHTKKNTS